MFLYVCKEIVLKAKTFCKKKKIQNSLAPSAWLKVSGRVDINGDNHKNLLEDTISCL